MSNLIAFARRHQLTLFFALAYAFSWWAWFWYRVDPVAADAPILPLGPFLAALVMLALIGGWPAIRGWLAKIVHWRVAPVWYAVALLGPPALAFGAVAITLATGTPLKPEWTVPGLASIAAQFVFVLLVIGLGEEPAWRGYALPRLLAQRTALTAALLLGVLHVIWHLPLFGREYNVDNVVPWAITVLCAAVITTWMWLHTGGSLLLPVLLHTSTNTVAFVWGWFAAPDQLRLWWVSAGLWVAATVAIVAVNGTQLARQAVRATA